MRLIEKVWFHAHPAKFLLVPLLLPFSVLFLVLSSLRRLLYRLKVLKSYTLSAPVIVVGNIGIGGNGKTPMVVLLVEQCRKLGLKPGVVSRGYGSNAPHYPYQLSEKSRSFEAGDEPLLIYQRCQVPVVIGADRVANVECLIEQGCNIIIADDGLQHYRLARAIEFIIVDGKRLFGNGLLLPAGPLREGLWRLNTVDFVVQNGKNVNAFADNTFADNKQLPLVNMALKATEVCHLLTGDRLALADFIKQHQAINAVAGIGSPARFFTTLREQNFTLNKQKGFIDHHHFKADDFAEFDDKLPLLMTEKDAVKCQGFAQQHWWYLPVSAHLPLPQLEQIQEKIKQIL
jgi:tetraacyldisaccharide 4'-kinase